MPLGSTDRPDTPAKRRLLGLACILALGTASCDACDIRPQPERRLAAYVAAIDPERGSAPALASALRRLPPRPQRSIELPWHTIDIGGPYLARTHQVAAPLFNVLWDLYVETSRRPPARPPDVATYIEQFAPAGAWGRDEAALRRHTAAWQRVAAGCRFAPEVEVGG